MRTVVYSSDMVHSRSRYPAVAHGSVHAWLPSPLLAHIHREPEALLGCG